VEDDHVDRPGVEERQRLKLTGTNSSIGLIVLIPYAHLTKSNGLVLTHACSALRAALRGCGASAPTVGRPCEASLRKAPRSKNVQGTQRPANSSERARVGTSLFATPYWLFAQKASRTTCVLPTWWLWRSGCTRSHSELGRETLQR
jgi:hypothetical protein